MTIQVRVNGNNSGEGFLIAPDGSRTFPAEIGLMTDDGTTVSATLQMAPGGASVVLSSTSASISPVETAVQIHATSTSASRNDTVLQVVVGGIVQKSFNLTAIANPVLWFQGRFQARFATDNDYYNHPRGTASGWNFALTGEPDFVPADSVPTTITKPVGRVVHFHNPVSLRSHCAPVAVPVTAISGTTGGGIETFTVGDPAIGVPVDLGPNTYLASNDPKNPTDPPPAETYGAGTEAMALFEFHVGNLFSGTSQVANDRPFAGGLLSLSNAEKTQYGVGTLTAFNSARKTALINDFNALSGADQAGTPGQNLKTRIGHLGGDAGLGVAPLPGTLSGGFTGKEEYVGLVNSGIQFGPSNSSVLAYFAGYESFNWFGKFLNYHSDEQCGQVHGSMQPDLGSGIPALETGIYNVQEREASPFAALNANQMTQAAIDAVLAGGSVVDKVVVTVGGTLERLVVSKVVVTNPGDPPASWTITSRGATLVGKLLPEASVFPRDLIYQILQPGDQMNVLGTCEGTPYAPPAAIGFARLFADGNVWKLLLHAGTNGAAGVTYSGPWSGSPATLATGCTPADIELLTPSINFGNVEEGMTMYREILLLNRSAGQVTVTLPAIPPPFGAPGANSVDIPAGETGALLVSFVAGTPGVSGPDVITLVSNPVTMSSLDASLTGTSVPVQAADIVMVLDRSGSMAEPALGGFRFVSKSTLRNEAAQMLVDLLRQDDRVGIVRFNEDAQQHMALEAAGVEMTGAGRVDAAMALASSDLNPLGSTSIGDGMFQANTMLSGPGPSSKRAMIVLTDGVENSSLFISDVTLGASVKAYCVGLGLPQNVNVDKLSAVAGNTGGYLLVTGELDAANEFRLHKYFAQILSGISADSIVVDPQMTIAPGDTQRIPFYVTEADTQFDAVLLTTYPGLRFMLEAPDGTRIDETNAAAFNGKLVQGKACRYYRMRMPVFAGSLTRALGKWNIVVDYRGTKRLPLNAEAIKRLEEQRVRALKGGTEAQRGTFTTVFETRRTYNVLVKARSAIQMDAQVRQSGLGPFAERELVVNLKAFGLPLTQKVNLVAQVTRPDGVSVMLPLQQSSAGTYVAHLDDLRQYGNNHIVVRASGTTPGKWPLQREQTLTAPVIDPIAKQEVDIRDQSMLDVLENEKALIAKLLAENEAKLKDLIAALHPGGGSLPSWLTWPVLLFILLLLLIILLLVKQ